MVIKYRNHLSIACLAAIAAVSAPVEAQRGADAVVTYPDARTLTIQRKVDALFERGEFQRALFIYRNELVPAGDKYAQYMVGYMHLMGMGTDEDPAAAFAWYRLASERGTPEFVAVRDQLRADLLAEEQSRSDAIYAQLRRSYSDLAVLLASIRRDVDALRSRSGSRLPGGVSPMTVADGKIPATIRSVDDYDGRVRRQLQHNLVSLRKLGDFPDLDIDPDRVDIDLLERLVQQRLDTAPD